MRENKNEAQPHVSELNQSAGNVTVGPDLNTCSGNIRKCTMHRTAGCFFFLSFFKSRHANSWKSYWNGLWYLSNHRRKEGLWKQAGGWQKQDDKALTKGLTWLRLFPHIKALVALLLRQLAWKAVHRYFKVTSHYFCCANSRTEPFLERYLWLQLQQDQAEKKAAIKIS